ncbi:NAD(P)H-binding protein [Limnohabitans sp.]|uniref:NAD(P)H-binding protein n=1 Tax=Limnohabitans sp. TaxID=1907725 RepID=UPI003341DCB0
MQANDFPVPLTAGHSRRVLLLGATGTIGLATAQALIQRGHDVVCFMRPRQSAKGQMTQSLKASALEGATFRYGDPTHPESLTRDGFAHEHFDAVISCMASRTGSPLDAWRVDHQAHVHALEAAQAAGVKHFILLSAICVQKPLLVFQHAKLAFEKTLIASGLTYSIVRPTAFFKSLSGQLERVKKGKPFLIFGDGQLTACKPISDHDLGDFIAGCLDDTGRHNQVLPIGGPGSAITPRQQGEYLFQLLGKEPRFKSVPVGLMDVIIGALNVVGKLIPAVADKAELARIGRYYATESMLVWDAEANRYDAALTPSHGKQTLFDAYEMWVKGQAAPDRGEHAVF